MTRSFTASHLPATFTACYLPATGITLGHAARYASTTTEKALLVVLYGDVAALALVLRAVHPGLRTPTSKDTSFIARTSFGSATWPGR